MQAVLANLNAVPGVVGTLLCGADGELIAHAMPPAFDPASLAETARAVAEGAAGLATITGPVRMVELRHAGARIVVRPLEGASLLFVCAPTAAVQPLAISASVAAPRLEKLLAERGGEPPAPPAPPPSAPAAAGGQRLAAVQRIDAAIRKRRLDPFKVRGEIAIKAGFGLGFIDAETPDDPEKLRKLKAAAGAVLGEPI